MHEDYFVHYLILFFGILITAVFFLYFRYNVTAQIVVVALCSLFYIGWGFVHHLLLGRLTKLIALEYILIGTFVFLLLYLSLGI